MSSATTYFSDKTDLLSLSQGFSQLAQNPAIKSLLVFVADANDYDHSALDALLQSQSSTVIGGIFPELVYQTHSYHQGCLIVGLPYAINVQVIQGLSDASVNYADQIEAVFELDIQAQTGIVFVDGLAKRISALVDGLFDVFGSTLNFIGGGAGSLSFVQKPCLLTNQGVIMDAAVIGLLDQPSRLGVGHGWKTIHADHQVTQVDKNIIYQIDNRNAFEVYSEIVNPHVAEPITPENFFSIAQAFPFGINKLNGDKVVRDPIAVTSEGGLGLICVGEIAQGDFVDILTANADELIASAGQTTQKAYSTDSTQPPVINLTIDCISRGLFLKEAFSQELEAIQYHADKTLPIVGALVLGEIANSGEGYLEFYNKTTAIAVL
ncbi:FIST signal transduction protein [Thiomicrospira microaerophila]|uniref:FIST signal transduction protein n=1 Tax=Thiomicrospira microaerophila TaxID=406020 RepID=UPI000A5C549B|nr:FIST N-terminal domain-containing protein [Thiomicrospira microaerophila]